MFVSGEEVTALRAEVERAKKDLVRIRREGEAMKQKKEYERLRRERSWGTSFDSKAVIIQLIDEELLFRLRAPCGHVG